MTHPFHPRLGHEFELVDYRQCWGEDRAFFRDEEEELRSIPALWTNVVADEPFVVVSAGRSLFRVDDLLELTKLVRGVER